MGIFSSNSHISLRVGTVVVRQTELVLCLALIESVRTITPSVCLSYHVICQSQAFHFLSCDDLVSGHHTYSTFISVRRNKKIEIGPRTFAQYSFVLNSRYIIDRLMYIGISSLNYTEKMDDAIRMDDVII